MAELAPAAEQVVAFLLNFFRTFPEYSTMDVRVAELLIDADQRRPTSPASRVRRTADGRDR